MCWSGCRQNGRTKEISGMDASGWGLAVDERVRAGRIRRKTQNAVDCLLLKRASMPKED